MDVISIKAQISKHIKKSMGSENPRLSNWYCGITNNESRRKAEHNLNKGFVKYWKCYDALTKQKANEIESYFSQKGTNNAPHSGGANSNSRYVYVFKLNTSYQQKQKGLGGPIISSNEIIKQLFS